MFKKILQKNRLIIAALCVFFAFALTAGVIRPAALSLLTPAKPAAAAKKQLPIYCVDTRGEKKVAVSFDAAWGEGRLGYTQDTQLFGCKKISQTLLCLCIK